LTIKYESVFKEIDGLYFPVYGGIYSDEFKLYIRTKTNSTNMVNYLLPINNINTNITLHFTSYKYNNNNNCYDLDYESSVLDINNKYNNIVYTINNDELKQSETIKCMDFNPYMILKLNSLEYGDWMTVVKIEYVDTITESVCVNSSDKTIPKKGGREFTYNQYIRSESGNTKKICEMYTQIPLNKLNNIVEFTCDIYKITDINNNQYTPYNIAENFNPKKINKCGIYEVLIKQKPP
jgi:hypothetical protein